MESTQIETLISQVKSIDLNSLREYSSIKNTINVIQIESLNDLQSQEKADETKQLQSMLNQQYCYQLGIRGDGNCFYRAVMLMKIFCLAQDNSTLPLEAFIQSVSDLKNIQIDLCASQVIQGSDLQLIFRLFLMKILSLKQQQMSVDILTVIREYNSLPELDFAACSLARYMIYLSFQKYRNNPQIQAFIDEDIQQDLSKIILKQKEYAEGIIIPLAAQSFQCKLVIQNINYEHGSPLKIKKETIVYEPMVLQQPDVCQIHLLFIKDHYDLLLLSQQCNNSFVQKNLNQQPQSQIYQNQDQESFANFQSFSEISTANQNTQKECEYISNKQNIGKNSGITDQENNIQNKIISIQNDFQFDQQVNQNNNLSTNYKNPSLATQNCQNENNKISMNNNKELDFSKCVSCKKKIYSFSEFYQIQQIQSNILEKICKICNQQFLQKQDQGILVINQNQYNLLAYNQNHKSNYISQQVKKSQLKKQQFYTSKSVQFDSQNFSNQIPFKKAQSEIQNQWEIQQNFDFQNFDTNVNKEEISFQKCSFVTNQQTLQKTDKNYIQNSKTIQQPLIAHKSQVSQNSNQDQSIQEQQLILFDESEEEEGENLKNDQIVLKNQYFAATLKPTHQSQETNKNNQKNNLYKCIKCKGPFKSQKYILQGKKLALLCGECLEDILKDLKKDQSSINIDNQTYKFGDSIIARINEQKLIDQSIRNSKINNTKGKEQQKCKIEETKQQKIQFKLLCNLCNKNEYSTYEISEVLKGGKEKLQRVCTNCIYLFISYYKHPSQLVCFDNKTYKLNELFSKYIYNIQLLQVQAETKVQQQVKHKEIQEKQKCIVCNSFCKERNPLFDINNLSQLYLIGHFCFYLNLNCIKDKTHFIFQGNTYILSDQLKQLAFEHISVQKNLLNKICK
ncbi:hypothetical protein ABPG74_009930 [Tetrahymena malaccensis]